MSGKTSLSFWGHNGFVVEGDTHFVAIDPWLSSRGAFCGSWFQYPCNHHLQDALVELSRRKRGWVFLTHEHEDHFDVDTLSRLDRRTGILVPRFRDSLLSRAVDELGFSPVELADSEEFSLPESISLTCYLSEVGASRDSAVLVKTTDFTFFNQNDCKAFDRLDRIGKGVTFYSVQFSGAIWHPVCYDSYSDDQKKAISRQKVRSKLDNVLRGIRRLQPRHFIAAAGPAVFPFHDPALSAGSGNIFIHQPALDEFLKEHGVENVLYPRPGDPVDAATSQEPIPAPSAPQMERYRAGLTDPWSHTDAGFCREDLVKALEDRLALIHDIDFPCATLLVLAWGEDASQALHVDLSRKKLVEGPTGYARTYRLAADPPYFALMAREANWQNLHLSMRARLYRTPDVFDNFLYLFLFSNPSNIRDAFITTLDIPRKRIVVTGSQGTRYEMDRYCPHQGADLSQAAISEDDCVVCPRHGWRFRLREGGRAETGNCGLSAVRLDSNS